MEKWQIENSETSEISEILDLLFRVILFPSFRFCPTAKIENSDLKISGKNCPSFLSFPRFPSFPSFGPGLLAQLVPLPYSRRKSLAILIECMIFLSSFLDVTRMSRSKVSFLEQIDSGILCL